MKVYHYKNTPIIQIVDVSDGWVILESEKNHPNGISNLYKIDQSHKEIWRGTALWGWLRCDNDILIVEDSYGEGKLNHHTGEIKDLKIIK
ncbi:hypothetical protein EBS43_12010 [bacterium]|jgi:hypothetical protein|nr:hypothetical protein [bacterium]